MKKFKTSIIYIIVLAVVSVLHFQLETLVLKLSAGTFFLYSIYGLFLAFFLVLLIKTYMAGKNLELAIALLIPGLIFFFLFSNSRFLFKLGIFEFFILGLLLARDNKKAKSPLPLPFVLLIGAACSIELVTNIAAGTYFFYLDVWINSLTGLGGYIAAFLLL